MGLRYHKNDERPAWVATITVNGVADDMTSGYTYTVKVAPSLDGTAVLSKTTGITGAATGVVTVAWAAGDLNIAPGNYVATLTARRTSDSLDWTIVEPVTILPLPT